MYSDQACGVILRAPLSEYEQTQHQSPPSTLQAPTNPPPPSNDTLPFPFDRSAGCKARTRLSTVILKRCESQEAMMAADRATVDGFTKLPLT